MKQEIREILIANISEMMDEYVMNWYNMQKPKALKKIGCPVGYGTLRKIVTDPKYNSMTVSKQCKLLKYYGVKHKQVFGNIEITKNEQEL